MLLLQWLLLWMLGLQLMVMMVVLLLLWFLWVSSIYSSEKQLKNRNYLEFQYEKTCWVNTCIFFWFLLLLIWFSLLNRFWWLCFWLWLMMMWVLLLEEWMILNRTINLATFPLQSVLDFLRSIFFFFGCNKKKEIIEILRFDVWSGYV